MSKAVKGRETKIVRKVKQGEQPSVLRANNPFPPPPLALISFLPSPQSKALKASYPHPHPTPHHLHSSHGWYLNRRQHDPACINTATFTPSFYHPASSIVTLHSATPFPSLPIAPLLSSLLSRSSLHRYPLSSLSPSLLPSPLSSLSHRQEKRGTTGNKHTASHSRHPCPTPFRIPQVTATEHNFRPPRAHGHDRRPIKIPVTFSSLCD